MLAALTLSLALAPQLGAFKDFIGGLPFAATLELVDIDADGDDDIVVVSGATGAVSVLRREPGGFASEPELLVDLERSSSRTVLADLDLDGDPDLLSLRFGVELVSSLNLGDAGFGAPEILLDQGLGGGPLGSTHLEVFDVVGDPRPEAVWIGDVLGAEDEVYLGTGLFGGTFSSQVIATVNVRTNALEAVDLDGDGDLDLAVLDIRGLRVIRNNGDGTFVPPVLALDLGFVNNSGGLLRAADVDGDLNQDLVLSISNRRFEVLPGDGALGFGPPLPLAPTQPNVFDLDLADLDLDGDLDVVYSSSGFGTPLVSIENLGGGGFGPPRTVSSEARFVRQLAVGDIDGDGLPEVVHGADPAAVRLRDVELGPPGMRIAEIAETLVSSPGFVDHFESADVDRDGVLDLVTGLRIDGELLWWRGLGAGEFDDPQSIPSVQALNPYQRILPLDLEGDGDLDFVLVGSSNTPDRWIEGLAPGVFGPTRDVFPGATGGGGLRPYDVDGDGDLDLVRVAGAAFDTLEWVEFEPTVGFGAPALLAGAPGGILALLPLDVDGDGDLDLVVDVTRFSAGESELGWIQNLGSGSFGAFASIALSMTGSAFPAGLAAGDLDGDGAVDLVRMLREGSPTSGATELFVLDGQAPAVFAAPRSIATRPGIAAADAVRVGDVDGDGDLDIVTGTLEQTFGESVARSVVALHRGRGDGTFEAPAQAAVQLPGGVLGQLVDVDGDGDLDVLGHSTAELRLGWYETLARGSVGLSYCGPAIRNSSGERGVIEAVGSAFAVENDLTLSATGLVPGAFTAFLASRTEAIGFPVMNSEGRSCLGAPVGVFLGPGQVQRSDMTGAASIDADLLAVPGGAGPVAALAGETWRFQAWFRDGAGPAATSNFTDAVRVRLD